MARFGYLMLHGGNWNGTQVVPASYVQAMSHTTSTAGVPNYMADPLLYANASNHYGLGWWNNAGGALPGVPRDAYWSWGLYDSFVLVVPSLDLVVSRAVGTKGWLATPNWGVYSTIEPFFAPIIAALPATSTDAPGNVGGTVPASLALTVPGPVTLGAFTPGVAKDYDASTTATVTSTAGDTALTVSEPGHLTNGAFSLPSAVEVSFSKSAWTGPVSNDPVGIAFHQHVGATDALRTGGYSTALTFTLSTTTP
jgi:hypothetical protein